MSDSGELTRRGVERIVSGGQTGVDRAALDWAIAEGVPHGGWCPLGRLAEDGRIPESSELQETPSARYRQRTEWNVRDSDATLIVARSLPLTGGTAFTARCAEKLGRPVLVVSEDDDAGAEEAIRTFVQRHDVRTLNVAGPRESGAPGLGGFVHRLLSCARGAGV